VDIQKSAAWANVGSFAIGVIFLYIALFPNHPQIADQGTAMQHVTYSHLLTVLFFAVLFLSGILHLTAALVQRKRTDTLSQVSSVYSGLVPVSGSLPSNPIEGRIFVGPSITPEYLLGLFEGHTSIQARKLIEPFIGKWLKISGNLDEVMSPSPNIAQVTFSDRGFQGKLASVYMYFRTKALIDRLATMRRGDSVVVIGEIRNVNSSHVELEDCELEGLNR
jgi:hypothetical protein